MTVMIVSLLVGAISLLGICILASGGVSLASQPASTPKAKSSQEGELDRDPKSDLSNDALPSLLIPAYTTHARFLPNPARHAFSYPLLYLGVDIDSLQCGRLDVGRLVRYGGSPSRTILGLRSDNYLSPRKGSLRRKVEMLLESRGISPEELGRVWLVTIPSFVGFEGINPLSVWYCYKRPADHNDLSRVEGQSELLCVILEVHNTFGEKHAYVLPTTSSLREEAPEGYHYSWTFPRSFHVSPFNSRNGFYRLDLVDPFPAFAPGNASASAKGTAPTSSARRVPAHPEIKVLLRLLTPSKTVKLQALLASSPKHHPVALHPSNWSIILRTIANYPLSLLMTTPRILYQAYRLHYDKKLAVYPRPEPRYTGAEGEWNPPELDGVECVDQADEAAGAATEKNGAGVGIGIGWQDESWGERMARGLVSRWCEARAREVGMGVEITFLDRRTPLTFGMGTATPSGKDSSGEPAVASSNGKSYSDGVDEYRRMLKIKTADPKFFTNLLVAPTRFHWLVLAPKLLTSVSSPALFEELFFAPTPQETTTSGSENRSTPVSNPRQKQNTLQRLAARRRHQYLFFLFSHSLIAPPPHLVNYPSDKHFTVSLGLYDQLRVLVVVALFTFTEMLEERIMRAVGAVFVPGREPWKIWERALRRLYVSEGIEEDGKVGKAEVEDLGSILID